MAEKIVEELAQALGGKVEWQMELPDGSGCAVVSMPLPDGHWLTVPVRTYPPMPWRVGQGGVRDTLVAEILPAARYAIRASTMNGQEVNFDPDAIVQNFIIGMLGYWTEDGSP